MSILSQLTDDMKAAMKAHDKVRVTTIRMVISQLKYARIDSGEELTTEQELGILLNAAKKRKEAIQAYESSERQDLLENERQELEIINKYLPEQMPDEEVEKIVIEIIESAGAAGLKDLGKVMSETMQKLKGKADGKKIQTIVRSKLA